MAIFMPGLIYLKPTHEKRTDAMPILSACCSTCRCTTFQKLASNLGLRVGLDVVHSVANRFDLFGTIIRDVALKGFFKFHHQLDLVEAVRVKVVLKGRRPGDLGLVVAHLLRDDFDHFCFNLLLGHSAVLQRFLAYRTGYTRRPISRSSCGLPPVRRLAPPQGPVYAQVEGSPIPIDSSRTTSCPGLVRQPLVYQYHFF